MTSDRKLWSGLAGTLLVAFTLLGFFGREVYRKAPPLPAQVVTASGRVLMTRDDILDGQQVWQSTGGQQLGSVWGHGAYQAPDWSADWLHREAIALLDVWAQRETGQSYNSIDLELQAGLRDRLRRELRTNTYDDDAGVLAVSDARAQAIDQVATHYRQLFGGDRSLHDLRVDYAMQDIVVRDAARLESLTDFLFWTSWAATTQRPASSVTYTSNWPHEPLVANRPTGANVLWTVVSVVLLLAGIGALVWWQAFHREQDQQVSPPADDPLASLQPTPSMRALAKYLGAVVALFGAQVTLGALTAHYTVEGQAFFGLPLASWLPYALTRTWHIQTAVFWIATAFLAVGLFIAPVVGGREPRYQRLGVNALFGALLIVVAGSLAGQFFAIHQKLGPGAGFWFGHQGYEYIDLGRAWQLALFVGLLLWLGLMLRGLWPALRRRDNSRTLVGIFTAASVAIGLMYGAGFFFNARTHLSVMEYWRWWVVHLWVEGFFEVFATAALAFVFARMGLVKPQHAGRAVVASSTLFLLGGIPGTFHHLYFSGTPTSIMAIGATFSALEVVPLLLIGLEAFKTYRMQHAASWMRAYRWPLRFFIGVAFWNLVGAGLFGFLINPPLALYYMQGLNTTPVHAHTALFGVYGLMSLGLVLTIARVLAGSRRWKEAPLAYSFWAMNSGLALMVALSLLPIGLAQTWASVEHGLWFARSAEFLQQPIMQTLRRMRLIGDSVFLSGVAALAWFMLGLITGHSYRSTTVPSSSRPPAQPIPAPAFEPALTAHVGSPAIELATNLEVNQ